MEIEEMTEGIAHGEIDAATPQDEIADLPQDGAEENAPADEEDAGGEAAAEASEMAEGESTADHAAIAREDLAILTAEIGELAGIQTLADLPDPARYGELRELGLNPIEAYYATRARGNSRRAGAASRAHLGVSVGRAATAAGARLTATEMEEARDLFPSLTDREIEALYRRVSNPRHA